MIIIFWALAALKVKETSLSCLMLKDFTVNYLSGGFIHSDLSVRYKANGKSESGKRRLESSALRREASVLYDLSSRKRRNKCIFILDNFFYGGV